MIASAGPVLAAAGAVVQGVGTSGSLVRDTRPAELLDVIRTVAAGQPRLRPGQAARLVTRFPFDLNSTEMAESWA